MYISTTYAFRNDLGRFDKVRFALEERIEHNARIRAFYRRCLLLPQWAKHVFEVVWFIQGLLPLILGYACEALVQTVFPDDSEAGEKFGLALFLAVLGVAPYFHWTGWVFILMTFQFVVWLWFANLMQNYAEKLRQEVVH